jgi:serine protease Do
LADIDSDRAKALKVSGESGVEVTKVEHDSPAASAGIETGDVLLSYNGENIVGAQQLGRLVAETPPGRRVVVQYSRAGKLQRTTIVTESPRSHALETPAEPARFEVPMFPGFAVPEIPSPLLLWRSPLIGLECEPVSAQLAAYFGVKHGLLVRSIDTGSPAEKAGLKAGDILTALGDHDIVTPRDLLTFLRTQRVPGKSIAVTLVRERRQLTLNVLPTGSSE